MGNMKTCFRRSFNRFLILEQRVVGWNNSNVKNQNVYHILIIMVCNVFFLNKLLKLKIIFPHDFVNPRHELLDIGVNAWHCNDKNPKMIIALALKDKINSKCKLESANSSSLK